MPFVNHTRNRKVANFGTTSTSLPFPFFISQFAAMASIVDLYSSHEIANLIGDSDESQPSRAFVIRRQSMKKPDDHSRRVYLLITECSASVTPVRVPPPAKNNLLKEACERRTPLPGLLEAITMF
jgi:hypothetical protein